MQGRGTQFCSVAQRVWRILNKSGMLQMLNVKKKYSFSINVLCIVESLILQTEYYDSFLNEGQNLTHELFGCFFFLI